MVDVHMHLYETKSEGNWWKSQYEIWEYGTKPDVRFGRYAGDLEDAVDALSEAGFTHGIAANLFSVDLFREQAISTLPGDLDPGERTKTIAEIESTMAERLRSFNRWLVDAVASTPQITPFVAVDPWALEPHENVTHLEEMADRGARGIKIHPVVQRFAPDDVRMLPIYRACEVMGLAVLSHTGSAKGGERFAEPAAFADVLRDFPRLNVVLAHLGGGSWKQTADLARAFPRVAFDLCEIVEWSGAKNAPSREQLAHLIADVGPERVMLGTDFPWYDLDRTVQQVTGLPVLSTAQIEGILGANAVR